MNEDRLPNAKEKSDSQKNWIHLWSSPRRCGTKVGVDGLIMSYEIPKLPVLCDFPHTDFQSALCSESSTQKGTGRIAD